MSASYKFILYADWIAVDEDGERTCESYTKNPNARVDAGLHSVIISCNCGDGTHTAEEAHAYITENWTIAEDEI